MPYYSEDVIEEIRMRNDIVDVISGYVRLQKKGSSYFGLCPFHNEKSPSFSVSPGKQMYYCFGCGAGGNVFTFMMEYENFTFPEALKFLADRAGIELPEIEYNQEMKKQADLKASILEMNKEAAKYYFYQLRVESGKKAFQYLINRGLTEQTIKKFGLGYSNQFGDDLYRYLQKKGYSDSLLAQSGLIQYNEKRGGYDRFWNRVIFPIMDSNQRVIGFGGRVLGDGKPKYLNSPETKAFDKSRNLYGLNFARISRRKEILLCEGYMDVISLHQAGFDNAVASLGTSFTMQQGMLLKRYSSEVLLTYDSDEAGTKAALRAIPILKEVGLSVKILHLEPYKDPDEFLKQEGIDEFEERIHQAENSFMFQLSVAEKKYDLNDPEDKTGFYKEIASMLVQFEEELERNNYLEAAARKYYIPIDSLKKLVNQFGMKSGYGKEKIKSFSGKRKKKEKVDGMCQSQKLLLTWIIEDERVFKTVKKFIKPVDFTEKLYRKVADYLFEQEEQGNINPAKIISCFSGEEEQKQAASLFHTKIKEIETKEEQEKALKETIIRVKQNSIEHAVKNLAPTDMEGLQNIVAGKKALQELEKLHISFD